MKKVYLLCTVLVWLLAFASCEKVSVEDLQNADGEELEGGVRLRFRVTKFEQTNFEDPLTVTRASIGEVCNKMNFAIYDTNNNRLKYVNQKSDDTDFGQISVQVTPGTYRVLFLAHSCSGNATTTNIEKITFPDNKVTDTFYYSAELQVDESKSYDIELKRVVSMFQLVVDDEIPQNVKKIKMYYTGGSSTLNGLTGLGCVNSKQTEIRRVSSTEKGQVFQAYTFLHDREGALKMTVSALDGSDAVVKEILFTDVPMTCNKVTKYQGALFGGGDNPQASTFALGVDAEWEGTETFPF